MDINGRITGGLWPLMPTSAWIIAFTIFLTGSGVSSAQSVYSYEDEDGVTHLSDQRPSDMEGVEVQRAFVSPQPAIDSRQRSTDEQTEWWFRNRLSGPVAVRIEISESNNALPDPREPGIQVLEPLEDRSLLSVRSADPTQSREFSFSSLSTPGALDVSHQPDRPYTLPFSSGSRFRITQGFGGEFSHTSPQGYYAVDFDMPVETPVHAARSGVVMEVARWFYESGEDLERYGNRANFIRIVHEDGTMAVYSHLDFEGVLVGLGEQVSRGQKIGRSGNTGFSTGPHLHFVVQKNRDMALVSVPIEFETDDGTLKNPEAGAWVSAP